MTSPKNTPVVALVVGFLVLVNGGVSQGCWWWKSRSAGCAQFSSYAPYPYPYPSPTGNDSVAYPAARMSTVDPSFTDPADIGVAIRACPPDMVPVYCDTGSGLWRETSFDNKDGCVHRSLVGTPCPGADKKDPKGKDPEMKPKDDVRGRLQPMVCDVQTRKFRRPNPGETPHAYLPAHYLGKPCALPKS